MLVPGGGGVVVLQAGEEEVTDSELGRLTAGQEAADVLDELLLPVVDDVVRHSIFLWDNLLQFELLELAGILGDYPHLTAETRGTQRMRKIALRLLQKINYPSYSLL